MYTNILKQCPHTLDNQQNKLLTGSVGAASSDNSSSSKKSVHSTLSGLSREQRHCFVKVPNPKTWTIKTKKLCMT